MLPDIDLTDFKSAEARAPGGRCRRRSRRQGGGELAERSVSRSRPRKARAAGDGDRLTIDFVGTIDGEAFEGGTGEACAVVLGQGNFIPGFEEGLTGAKAGEERDVNVTFPDDYPVADAGRQGRRPSPSR